MTEEVQNETATKNDSQKGTRGPRPADAEVKAMGQCVALLEDLDNEQRLRVLLYLKTRFIDPVHDANQRAGVPSLVRDVLEHIRQRVSSLVWESHNPDPDGDDGEPMPGEKISAAS